MDPPLYLTSEDNIPNVWIDPDRSVILQVKCAELVPSAQFSVGLTCR